MRIWVTTHGWLYDPTNARERRSLHEDTVDAESDKTSERILRDVRNAAKEGKPHGKKIYGYLRTRCLHASCCRISISWSLR